MLIFLSVVSFAENTSVFWGNMTNTYSILVLVMCVKLMQHTCCLWVSYSACSHV